MIISVETPEYEKYLVYDSAGHVIPYVISFDTDKEEIELSIGVNRKEKEEGPFALLMQSVTEGDQTYSTPTIVKFKLPGAYATKDGAAIQ